MVADLSLFQAGRDCLALWDSGPLFEHGRKRTSIFIATLQYQPGTETFKSGNLLA